MLGLRACGAEYRVAGGARRGRGGLGRGRPGKPALVQRDKLSRPGRAAGPICLIADGACRPSSGWHMKTTGRGSGCQQPIGTAGERRHLGHGSFATTSNAASWRTALLGPAAPIVLRGGAHDLFVAFSCKGRGLCPSCNARGMAETAAHLVDHVSTAAAGAPVAGL